MGMLLAVLTFFVIVAAIGVARAGDDDLHEVIDGSPKRVPDPSPRDRYAVTVSLGSAPVPSWG